MYRFKSVGMVACCASPAVRAGEHDGAEYQNTNLLKTVLIETNLNEWNVMLCLFKVIYCY